MMQDYPFTFGPDADSLNTSAEIVSAQPSQQVLDFIRAFARCVQTLEVDDREITICLN